MAKGTRIERGTDGVNRLFYYYTPWHGFQCECEATAETRPVQRRIVLSLPYLVTKARLPYNWSGAEVGSLQ